MNRLLLRAFHASGLASALRVLFARSGRFVIELHGVPRVRDRSLPLALRPCIVRDELASALRWLGQRFDFLSPYEFLAGNRTGLLVTFDDGFANQATEALPVLEALRVPAIFFVTTRHVEDPVDWLPFVREMLAEHGVGAAEPSALNHLFDGMSLELLQRCAESPWITIGSHTVHHPFLDRSDDAELRAELEDSRQFLEHATGKTIDLLAYPTGAYDARVARAAEAAGYRAAFTEDSRGLGLGRFEIPRIGLYSADPAYLAAKVSGLHRRPLPVSRKAEL